MHKGGVACLWCAERKHLVAHLAHSEQVKVTLAVAVNGTKWQRPETCPDLWIGCASPIPLILSLTAGGHSNSLNWCPLVRLTVLTVRFHSCKDDRAFSYSGKYENLKPKKNRGQESRNCHRSKLMRSGFKDDVIYTYRYCWMLLFLLC